jgi:dolichol-phosphate mannosyltransferase
MQVTPSEPLTMRFAVVIPMYHEEQGAEACVRAVTAALGDLDDQARLIVVDDGSRDATPQILARLAPECPRLEVVTHPGNRGYGAALKTGAEHAATLAYDYVLFMDSDLTNDPKYLPLFVEKMGQGYSLIKASRYMRGGGVNGVPLWRVVISRVGNRIAGLLYGLPIHDCTNGFRAVRLDLFRRMELSENRFPVIMEELYWAKHLGATVVEVPNTLTNRSSEQRPTSFAYRPSTFYRYLKYAVLAWLRVAPGRGRAVAAPTEEASK